MKRSFALLLCAAAFACSSEKDEPRQIHTATTTQPAAAPGHDSAMAAAPSHDSAMAAMPHDSGHKAPISHESMAGMNHAKMPSMPMRGSHAMGKMPKHEMRMPANQPSHDMPMQHSAMSMNHDSMRAMNHDTMPAMNHDTMPAMNHDTMRTMNHDTMPAMNHDTMAMIHDMAGMTDASDMLMTRVGPLTFMGMAQFFPTFTFAAPRGVGAPLNETGFYVTQPAIMSNISTPNERFVLRTTLNFEGITQPGGELTFGGWGEGFIDKRHPHTLLHEFMLSWNNGNANRGFSISAGKGFAPYGTDDPMSRPVIKYPTNHHLSQALERWTLSGVLALGNWGLEGGVFGGQEPTGPYDFSNIKSFGDSWSARATKRFGTGQMGTWPWELSASFANIAEKHDGTTKHTGLLNFAVRHDHEHQGTPHYALIEYSRSSSDEDEPYFSILGETSVRLGRHEPYARFEYADRPEYRRSGPRGTDQFFRYDHDSDPIAATRWLILTGGYGVSLGSSNRFSPRPYIEAQYNHVRNARGAVDPVALFGRNNFWSVSAGLRVFIGGEPMRMGTYGILDPMTAMHDMSGHQMSAAGHDN